MMLCEVAYREEAVAPRTCHVFAMHTDAESYYELWVCEDMTSGFLALYPDVIVNQVGRVLKARMAME